MEGKMKYTEDRVNDIGNAGAHFTRLMNGQKFGDALVVVRPEVV